MRPAFTLVELIVVVTVIVLVLALAVPGLTAMNAEARMTAAVQQVNGLTTRAYYISVADRCMTAVRFMPSEWDIDEQGRGGVSGRQRATVYKYIARADREVGGNFTVYYEEYFKRAEGVPSTELPDDVWVAPLEALSDMAGRVGGSATSFPYTYSNFGADFVLDGHINEASGKHLFVLNANPNEQTSDFLNADDFLIVFDPQAGLRTGRSEPYLLQGLDPTASPPQETLGQRDGYGNLNASNRYQRLNFSGLTFYRREPFVALGSQATGAERQRLLRERGRPYMVQRFSGGLLSGMQGQE